MEKTIKYYLKCAMSIILGIVLWIIFRKIGGSANKLFDIAVMLFIVFFAIYKAIFPYYKQLDNGKKNYFLIEIVIVGIIVTLLLGLLSYYEDGGITGFTDLLFTGVGIVVLTSLYILIRHRSAIMALMKKG